jgi:sporulation protein YlmC with PRC-barrel domain
MKPIDLARDVLDSELIDADGTPCGRVDNLDLEIGSHGELRVRALLVGPGALSLRLPAMVERLVQICISRNQVIVPWSEIERVDGRVRLRRRADELKLANANRIVGRWIAKLPWS